MIIRIKGGLGNQMFQYAMARGCKKDINQIIALDNNCADFSMVREFRLDLLSIQNTRIISKRLSKWYKRIRYLINRNYKVLIPLSGYGFEKSEFIYQDNSKFRYLDGYWQNVQYFDEIKDILKKEYKRDGSWNNEQKELLEKIERYNSVGIHVRRGDYLNEINSKVFVCQDIDYYLKAIGYIESKEDNLRYFVFSDDIEWCKTVFPHNDNILFIDNRISTNEVDDFEMLKKCRHHIISNSSYSWWASWLSDGDGINIAPRRWYHDDDKNEACIKALLRDMLLI